MAVFDIKISIENASCHWQSYTIGFAVLSLTLYASCYRPISLVVVLRQSRMMKQTVPQYRGIQRSLRNVNEFVNVGTGP